MLLSVLMPTAFSHLGRLPGQDSVAPLAKQLNPVLTVCFSKCLRGPRQGFGAQVPRLRSCSPSPKQVDVGLVKQARRTESLKLL